MSKLAGVFSKIENKKTLVIGDLLCDAYTVGKARRISPEAPVAVVDVQHEESRPGGAGNVALNLKSLGLDVIASGRIGFDARGEELLQSLALDGISTYGIVKQSNYYTPVKNRIIADNQQIVRIDHEEIAQIPEQVEQQVIELLPQILKQVSVVAISDYGKGFLSQTLLTALLEHANQHQVPVIVDPKGLDFRRYRGATLIKPNLKEAYAASNLPPEASLDQVAERLLEITQTKYLLITRSEDGISIFGQDGTRQDFSTDVREVKDVTGAGDTVLATLTCAFANGLDIIEAAQLSNVTAGIAIEQLGCARVTLSELARRLLIGNTENKVFDEEHLFALQEALRGRRYQVLGISESDGLRTGLFKTIRLLAAEDRDLLLYIRDVQPSEEFVNVVASLQGVDFVILKSDSLQHLCTMITPEAVSILEEDSLKSLEGVAHL